MNRSTRHFFYRYRRNEDVSATANLNLSRERGRERSGKGCPSFVSPFHQGRPHLTQLWGAAGHPGVGVGASPCGLGSGEGERKEEERGFVSQPRASAVTLALVFSLRWGTFCPHHRHHRGPDSQLPLPVWNHCLFGDPWPRSHPVPTFPLFCPPKSLSYYLFYFTLCMFCLVYFVWHCLMFCRGWNASCCTILTGKPLCYNL